MSIENLVKENIHDGFGLCAGEVVYNGKFIYSGKTVYLYFMMLHYFDHDQFSYNALRTELYEDVDALFHQKSSDCQYINYQLLLLHQNMLQKKQ